MRNFADVLYQRRANVKSNIILKIDTNFEKLPPWLKKSKVSEFGRNWAAVSESLVVYEKYIIETISPYICCIMPRLSSYLQYGAYGLRALECTIVQALRHELPVIVDARFAEYSSTNNNLAGNGVIGRVMGWDGLQPSNLHAHGVSIIPYYGKQMIEDYINLCDEMNRGLVVVCNENTDFNLLSQYANRLIGNETENSGLTVMIEDHNLPLINKVEKSSLSTIISFPDIYDAIEMQQLWDSLNSNLKKRTFVSLGSEIHDSVDSSGEPFIKDEEIIKSHFSDCVKQAKFYQKLFFI